MIREVLLELLWTMAPVILAVLYMGLVELTRTDAIVNLCQRAKRSIFK